MILSLTLLFYCRYATICNIRVQSERPKNKIAKISPLKSMNAINIQSNMKII